MDPQGFEPWALLALQGGTGTRSERYGIHIGPIEYTLKTREKAERYCALSEDVAEVLDDYINHKRMDIEDDYERVPSFATENGRAPVKTLRRWFRQ